MPMASQEFTIGSWVEHPYTSHDKRHIKVEHRVRVLVYDGGFADVNHERRENDGSHTVPEWRTVESVEIRDHGARHEKYLKGVLQE
jgi:hypothetical protein